MDKFTDHRQKTQAQFAPDGVWVENMTIDDAQRIMALLKKGNRSINHESITSQFLNKILFSLPFKKKNSIPF